MKSVALFALAPAVLAALGGQGSLPEPLAGDFAKLASAQSLHVHYTFLIGSDSQGRYDLWMSRDKLFKLAYPGGFVLSDGQNIYTYTKATNSYSKAPLSDRALAAFDRRPEVFAWAPFFEKSPELHVQSAQLGQSHSFRGSPVQDVTYQVTPQNGKATVFIDQGLGVARGAKLETDKVYLAQADEISVSDKADSSDKYAFVAPDGATETAMAGAGVTYAQVQDLMNNNCMPCHNSNNQRAGFDLTNYGGVASTVQPGKSSDSLLIKALTGNGADLMPRGRAPLSDANIHLIQQWIDSGAKNQ